MADKPTMPGGAALEQSLATWLTAQILADDSIDGSAEDMACELAGPPPSGNSNVTLPFVARWNNGSRTCELGLVLRMQHPANQIFLDADVQREFHLLKALAEDEEVIAPIPRWFEDDSSVLGHPFFVMDRIIGSVPVGIPSIHLTGWLSERSESERNAAWESSIEAIAGVHKFDWQAKFPAAGNQPSGTTMAERLVHMTSWYEWSTKGRPYPVTDVGLTYLQDTVGNLKPSEPVLLWGDARMGNLMFGANARVNAVLDWELASVGPAGIDVGWWLTFEEFSTGAHDIAPLPGYPDRSTTIAAYERASGTTLTDIEWYEKFAAWAVAVTVIRMADIGVAEGRLRPETKMGHGNLMAQMLARKLDLPVPDLDPDYAARRGLA